MVFIKNSFTTLLYFLSMFILSVLFLSSSFFDFDLYSNTKNIPLFNKEISITNFFNIFNSELNTEPIAWISVLPYFFLILLNKIIGIQLTLVILLFFVFVSLFLFFRAILFFWVSEKKISNKTFTKNTINFFAFFGALFFVFSFGFVVSFYAFDLTNLLYIIFLATQLSLLINYYIPKITKNNKDQESVNIVSSRFLVLKLFLLSIFLSGFLLNFYFFIINFILVSLFIFSVEKKEIVVNKIRKSLAFGVLPFLFSLILVYLPVLVYPHSNIEFRRDPFSLNFITPFFYQFEWLNFLQISGRDQSLVPFYKDWKDHTFLFSTVIFVFVSLLFSFFGYLWAVKLLKDSKLKFFVYFIVFFTISLYLIESLNITHFTSNIFFMQRYSNEVFVNISFSLILFEFVKILGIFLFGISASIYFYKIFKINLNGIILISIFLPSMFYMYPVLQGKIFNNNISISIPKEYNDLYLFLDNYDSSLSKVLILPIDIRKSFAIYSWGYTGTGFQNYLYNKTFLNQFSFYSTKEYYDFLSRIENLLRSPSLIKIFLQKENINYVVWDNNILLDDDTSRYYLQTIKPFLDDELIVRFYSDNLILYSVK